ncbi:hypothetical protein B005_2379 [Nocardiopsis alba ATCC BAA-2165]|uniref:Uncharacterized protein n=1 Tax=Nocardiopsis alba (strain ATCC BAA-2165 / BE74) TaxID=1205910 RepID=J7L8W5_NOCAA|nr:hypothetical protein B005_2379 [Nocardiopsis alba ATCC BAA-2165]
MDISLSPATHERSSHSSPQPNKRSHPTSGNERNSARPFSEHGVSPICDRGTSDPRRLGIG